MLKLSNQNGFNLIEMMISLSILGIIMLAISGILSFNTKLVKHEEDDLRFRQQNRMASNQILRIARENNTLIDKMVFAPETPGATTGFIRTASSPAVIFDTTKRTSNDPISPAQMWYYYEADQFGAGNGYGEIRDINGDKIASYIRDIEVSTSAKTITVKLTAGKTAENTEKIVIVFNSDGSTNAPVATATPTPGLTPTPTPTPTPTSTATPAPTGTIGPYSSYPPGTYVAGYTFEEEDGTGTASDGSGNDYTGSLFHGTTRVEGVTPGTKAVYFGGHQDAFSIPKNSPELVAISTEMTIMFYVKPTTSGTNRVLISKYKHNDGYQIELNAANKAVFTVETQSITSTVDVPTNSWSLIKVTYNSLGFIKLTVDSSTVQAVATRGTIANANEDLWVASTNNHQLEFTGMIDELRILNEEL